jgi:para-aminobenzoate synthetase component 1
MPAVLSESARVRRVDLRLGPLDLLARWPVDRPIVCLVSGGSGRWSIVAQPVQVLRERDASDALRTLDQALRNNGAGDDPTGERPLFTGGWIGWLSYDLGRRIEPHAAGRGAADDRGWPLFELFRCPSALVHDASREQWFEVGETLDPALMRSVRPTETPAPSSRGAGPALREGIGAFKSRTGREAFERAVSRAVEYIRAGDVFQVNLAHRLSASFEGSPRGLALRLLRAAGAPYGAYFESPGEAGGLARALISVSPELFLEFDPRSRRVVTRPIKGTRPARPGAESDLRASSKDEAELTMIVDLMRNDLGRVCEFGSVRVEEARRIERHERQGVVHASATVSGRLREEITHADLLRAAFPPGSVTGAPKIRAMQIIDELEPVRRGPYCGAVGFVSDSGHSSWNVAIRTAALSCDAGGSGGRAAGVIDYSVGAGIVAESIPAREWQETLDKARILRAIQASLAERPA